MTGEVIFVAFFMLVIAAIAFLPLGYFIMAFTKNSKQPFGKPHSASHGLTPFMAKCDPYLQKLLGEGSVLQLLVKDKVSKKKK